MAKDLAADAKFEVTVADIDRAALHRLNGIERLTPIAADLRAAEMVRRLAEAHDFVVGAVPGPMHRRAMNFVERPFRCRDGHILLPETATLPGRAGWRSVSSLLMHC